MANEYGKDIDYADSKSIVTNTNRHIRRHFASKQLFITDINGIPKTNKSVQFKGIDKIVMTAGGKIFKIEEKVRRRDYGDILVELYADNNFYLKAHRGTGWIMKDYSCDIIMFYYENTDRSIIFSWKMFQYIFKIKMSEWYDYAKNRQFGFSLKKAENTYRNGGKYHSLNMVVPEKFFMETYSTYKSMYESLKQ